MFDEAALLVLRGGQVGVCRIYMSYQPCHHSGGRVSEDPDAQLAIASRRGNQAHPTSCSERLKAFFDAELRGRQISLELVVADLYKVMWTEELMVEAGDGLAKRTVYTNDAASGQEGMRMLLSTPGVVLRAMGEADWTFLVTLCDGSVRDAYHRRCQPGSSFTRAHVALRRKLDAYVADFIQKLTAAPNTAPTPAPPSKFE